MAGTNPFFDLDDLYGADVSDEDTWFTQHDITNKSPGGAYERFLTTEGLGGYDRQSTWARNQQRRMEQAFEAALRVNNNLNRNDFYKSQKGNLNEAWMGASGAARGDFQPAQTRWVRF